MRLLGNIYFYPYRGIGNNCNTYLFDDEMRVIIDPGHSWNLNSLLKTLKEDGFLAQTLDLIMLTHLHPDHCEATDELAKLSKAKIALHKKQHEYLVREPKILYGFWKLPRFRIGLHLIDELSLGKTSLKILHTPGHSPGGISIYWDIEKTLICGDLIFSQGVGRWDLPGGDLKLLQESLKRISQLEVEYLLPGHGEIIKGSNLVKKNFDYIKRIYGLSF